MKQEQLEQLRQLPLRVLTGEDLVDKTPRTLLYGYTTDRNTWHVYLDAEARIQVVCYSTCLLISHLAEAQIGDNKSYVPNKRLYPESCDYEFCALLSQAGVSLPFTTFDPSQGNKRIEGRPDGLRTYPGKLAEELGERSIYIGSQDMPGVTDPELCNALLSQAIAELGVSNTEAYPGYFLCRADRAAVLERAHALLEEMSNSGLDFYQRATFVQERLRDLGLFGIRVERLSQLGGTLVADASFQGELVGDVTSANGFDVTGYGSRGTRVQRQRSASDKGAPTSLDMVLVPEQGTRDGFEQHHRIFLHLFGSKDNFTKYCAMLCR